MGSEPIDSEIPVDFDDLNLDTQEAFNIYTMLQDSWDTMNGHYIGKNYSGLMDILKLQNVEDEKTTFALIRKIDDSRAKAIKDKTPVTKAPQT